MAHLYRVALALLLAVLAVGVRAADLPAQFATNVYKNQDAIWVGSGESTCREATAVAAMVCVVKKTFTTHTSISCSVTTSRPDYAYGPCLHTDPGNPNYPGTTYAAASREVSPPMCPAFSQEKAGQNPPCRCDVGYKPDAQSKNCVSDVDMLQKCKDDAGMIDRVSEWGPTTTSQNYKIMVCIHPAANLESDADKGCVASFERQYSYQVDSGPNKGKWMHRGTATIKPAMIAAVCSMGEDEDPEKPAGDKPKCPKGQPGTVNGVEVCVPFDPDKPTVSEHGPEDEETDNGTETVRRTTNSRTTCSGNTCTTTTTVTTTTTINSTGASTTSTTTTTSTSTLGAYCAKNPNSSNCTGKPETPGSGGGGNGDGEDSQFGGNCTAGFTCEGDAIQCAMAKEQHKQWCELNAETAESDLYNEAKTKTGSITGDLEGNKDVDIASYFTGNDMFGMGGGSCFPDKAIEVMGKVIVIPFSTICPYIGILGNILVLISCISAARIVTRKS